MKKLNRGAIPLILAGVIVLLTIAGGIFLNSKTNQSVGNVGGGPGTINPLPIKTFLGLTDTPSSYSGQGGKAVVVNAGATALEFGTASGGGTWGSITGTLSDQTDLNTALGLKAPLASPTFTGSVTMPGTGIWNSSGNVGIGTTGPGQKLEVIGNIVIPNGNYYMAKNSAGISLNVFGINSGTNVLQFGSGSLDALRFDVGAANRMYITSDGNVGIGTTSPTSRLHLAAGTATAGTAPLGFTSGTLLTTPVAGKVEFLTDAYYGTITTGPTRKQFAFTDGNITGSAATLTTPRAINGVNFDGSAAITLPYPLVFTGNTSIATPADATTYYFGSAGFAGSTSQNFYHFRAPRAGTIKTVVIEQFYSGTQPTTETSTINMKVNGGSDVVVLNNTFHNDTNGASWINTGLSTAVAQGESIEFNWTTPTWATNPGTSITIKTTVYME